jgi:hypothetical protein
MKPDTEKALADPKILGRAKKAPHPVLLNNEARLRHGSIHKKAPPVSTFTSDVRRQHSIRKGHLKQAKNCQSNQVSQIGGKSAPPLT